MPIVTPGLSDEDYKKYFTDDKSERSLSYYDENGNFIGGGSVPQNVSPSSISTVYKNPNGTYSPVSFATDEAKSLYKAWSTPPRVSIENGNLKLTGTKDFLQTDTAEQLRKIFKEMEGQTYNTEALNQQIEAWNTDLQRMSEENSKAILSMNEMNTSVQENVRGTDQNAGMQLYTWEDYQRIANSAAVGRDQNAANSENLIFVGYEWDDEGNRVPKYVKAKDFYTEFNSIDDSKKRQALSDLVVQMNNGDAGAASKLAFLQGKSEGGAANIELGAGQRFLDMASTASLRFLGKMANAADFITTWTFFGIPRQINRVARGWADAASGGDFISGYMKDDVIRSAINDFNDVVDWETAFKMQLTPGSTKIAATLGDSIGTIAGMAYSIWGGSVANAVGRTAVNKALSAASDVLVKSGHGVTYTSTLGGEGAVVGAGNIQPAKVLDGARIVDQGVYIGDRAVGQVGASVTLPKWLVQTAPNFSQKLAEVGLRSQMAQQVAGITSGLGENGIFTIMRPGAAPVIVTGESLSSLRATMQGLMTARNFAPLVGNSVLRNLDNYFAEKNRGGDPGDLKDYIVTNTVTDIIYGAVMVGVGSTIKGLRDAARASGEPTIKILNAADVYSANSTAGFYSQPDQVFTAEYDYSGKPQELSTGKGLSVITEAEKLITANGEKFFLPSSALPSAVPTSIANEGVGMVGNISKNSIKTFEIAPAGDGFVLTTTTTDIPSGKITTSTDFHPTYEEAAREAQKGATPTVNPATLMNSDLAATGNIVPFKIGGRSALKILPNGVSRARIQPNISYLTPSEYATEVTPIVEAMTPELRAAYEKAMVVEDIDSLSQQIYAKDAPAMDAPRLFVPRTEAEAIELAQSVARAQAVAAANPNSSPVMPVQTEPDDVEIVKRRRMVTDRVFYAHPASEFQAPEDDIADFAYANGSARRNDWQETEHGAMLYATGGIPTEVDTYPDGRNEKSIQSITGKNYNTPSLLRSRVGKDNYDLGESLFALEILRNIADGGATNWYVNTTGIKTATTAKNFIANVYGGEKFYRNGIVIPLKGEYLYDLSYHILGEQLDDPYFKINDIDNQYLRMLDENPGATREGSLYEYYRDYKGKQVSVVRMHPDDYFKILKKETGLTEAHIDEMRGNTKYYDELFANGGKADVPYLLFDGDSTGKYNGQEGRHRILAAQKKGAQYVPVIIVHPAGTSVTDFIGPAISDTGHYYADWTNSVKRYVTTYSEYGRPEIVAKEEIDKIYAEVDNSISAHERVYGDKVPRDGINALKDIVRKNEDKVISSIIKPNQETMDGLFDKISTKAMQNLAKGLEAAISKQGAKAITDFRAPGFFDSKTGIVHILSNNFDPLVKMEGSMTVHIPKGTKLLLSNFPAITDFGTWIDDYRHYVVGAGKGYRITDDGLFINTPKGEPHYPKVIEFTPGSAAIYATPDEAFDSEIENYQQFAKDFLKPLHSKEELRDIYKVLLPGGRVNETNAQLRTAGSFGKLPETTLTTFITDIIANINNSYVTGYGSDAGEIPVIRAVAAIEEKLRMLSEDFPELYNAFSSDDSPVMSTFNKILKPLKQRVAAEEENGILYFPGGYLTNEELNEIRTELMEVAINETNNLPKGLTRQMKAIQKMEGDASHESLAPWVGERGMATGGNRVIKDSSDFAMDLDSLEVGDDYVDPGFAFITLNPAVPTYYTSGGKTPGNKYIIRYIGQEGTKVYHFGDTENFTDRVHVADGGAMIIPRNAHGKIVSKIPANFNGEKVTILYVVLDGKDGAYNGPVDNVNSSIEMVETKKRKTIEVEQRTPRNIVVTEYGLPKKWFSDMDEALDYKNESGARSIYKVDESATVLDRPPVTMDNVYMPTVRGEMGASVAMGEQDFSYTPNTEESVSRFNGLLEAMPELVDSPTDYAQGILDIASEVQNVYDEIAKATDVNAVYEDYARQIADDVEQPTASDSTKELFKPLTDMLNKLGLYFDPSGKSLTKDFYLPTGAPSKKLASIEDAILHPERAVDVDKPVDGSFDDILVDPMRIGDSGFWEKRSGELFRDEDGNFTMAKAGTLQENLTAYVVSALTRGKNRLTIAANNEVARSKYDRNRNQITAEQALKGLRDADKNRTRIRAAQIKNARGYSRKLKDEKIGKLESDYSDKESIDAIEDAYDSTNFAKEIDYTRRANAAAKELGYRQTLTINNIKGSALRFGSNNMPFRGIANDIRKMSRITVTGTKWVKRHGEYVNVGFGLTEAQRGEYDFTRTEPAVNLGDSANLLFSPDRAAAALYQTIQDGVDESVTTGGWTLTNSIKDFARQNFPLISDPKRAAERLVREINKNYSAYDDTKAFNIANLASIETWIKQNAANNINSAIQMADITNLDERTRDAIDQVMTKANVGASVYTSKIVSALQTATYQATLAFNTSPMIGNALSEPERIIDVFGYKVFFKSLTKIVNKEELARVKSILDELPSRFADDREMVGLAEKAKTMVGRAIDTYNNIAMSPLQKSEEFKNILFWLAAEENAKLMYPNDPSAQLQNTLRMFNDTAIAGGPGTTPGVANSNLGRAAFVLKTFSLRNWDDFIEMTEQIGRGRSGSYKWDRTNRGGDTGGQGGYSSTAGKKKFNYKKAGQFIGGTLLRRYLLWLMVLGPLGRSIWDALGGDPTGLTENFSRGLYDDEGTDEYEGMTPLDNIINAIPTGFIFGTLKDFYFAARRAGVDTGNFFGQVDLAKDPRLQKDLRQHLPLGTVTNRIGDMLELLDRGYSYNSFGNKTYAAPETFGDALKGFMLGKSTTDNAQAYNKYRYGSVNIWGDIFEGDWLDFAMSANPFAADMGMVKMDTTRTDYKGVFHGSYNDVPTMQAAVADLRERRLNIIREYNEDLEKYTGQFEGLNDSERKAKAAERREKKIDDFTNDVSRLVDAYTKAGNALSDKQINTLMYLFDFNEGDEDTYDSQLARERYVEAGLPDLNPVNQVPKQDKETGEIEEQNYFQRSLVYQNAVQGRYGIPREAAKAVDSALADFKNTYKEYKKRVSDLNDKAYSASKGSAERKRLQSEVEKVQEEYLNQLYAVLTPVVQQYGTEVLSSNDVIESLQPYMSSMVPYSSIKKYGLQFNSGNDIVWGQLSDWVKSRWGASAPTAGSDPEITDGIKQIKALKDQGKTAQAKSQARLLLDRIARGSLSARNNDVIELRSLLYD